MAVYDLRTHIPVKFHVWFSICTPFQRNKKLEKLNESYRIKVSGSGTSKTDSPGPVHPR